MRNAVLYTKTPLNKDNTLEQLSKLYKNANGNDSCISVGKQMNSLYIWLPSTNLSDPIDKDDMMDGIENIPFPNPYFTHIDFHQLSVLKRVVEMLYKLYPEMIVWTDDDKFYSAVDFIDI